MSAFTITKRRTKQMVQSGETQIEKDIENTLEIIKERNLILLKTDGGKNDNK